MPTQAVTAELQRRDATAALVAWTLTDDAQSTTGKADPVIDAGVRASLVTVLTRLSLILTQLQSTLAVAGTVTVANPTAQGLTDVQLRATAVPVSNAALPLPTGAATEATVTTLLKAGQSVNVGNLPATQPVSGTVTVANPTAQGLTDTQLRATAVPVTQAASLPAGGNNVGAVGIDTNTEPTAATTTLTTATPWVYTPAVGKSVQLLWVQAIPDPQATTNPVITVALGGVEMYRGYAIAHRAKKTGPVNGTLTVTLSAGGTTVPVTAHLLEV